MKTLTMLMRSRVKIKVLRHFMDTKAGIRVRELSRAIDEDAGNTKRVLSEFKKYGILEQREDRYYSADDRLFRLLQQIDERN